MTEFDKMVRLLETSWCMRREIVPCLVGPPGIGKTAAVMYHAENHGSNVIKIVASRCVPSETVGMTMPDHKNRSMTIYNSMQLSSLKDGDILFLDELLEADQFVLSTLLTVIESREMADGTPLPNIQIIAATNDTIPSEQLKGNIRQRFMFQRFTVDKEQTAEYIFETTGIRVSDSLLSRLCDDGRDYNFLTPRSLSKLAHWISEVSDDDLYKTAEVINEMWGTTIGTILANDRCKRDAKIDTPEVQVRKAIKSMITNNIIPEHVAEANDDFNDCTLGEMLEVLQKLPEWDAIAFNLQALQIREEEEGKIDITF